MRLRTKPTAELYTSVNVVERRKRLGEFVYEDWKFAHNDINNDYTLLPKDAEFSDVVGSVSECHPCNHTLCDCDGTPEIRSIIAPEPPIGVFQYRCLSYKLSPRLFLYSQSAHLATALGLESLSRARIPALVRSDLQGFVSLAEMGQQAESGAVALTRAIGSLALAAYRGRPTKKQKKALRSVLLKQKDLRGVVNSLIGHNLEWQFGWKPFIKDLTAATQAFDKISLIHKKLEKGTRVFGKAVDVQTDDVTDIIIGSSYNSLQVRGTCTITTTKTVTSSIVRRIRNDKIGGNPKELMLPIIYDLFGLKPSLSKAWALVPGSFVVDWIYPVESVLETWEGMAVPQSDWIESFGDLESVKTTTVVNGSVSVRQGNYDMGFSLGGSCKNETYSRYIPDFASEIPAPYVPVGPRIPSCRYWFTGLQLALQRMLR